MIRILRLIETIIRRYDEYCINIDEFSLIIYN